MVTMNLYILFWTVLDIAKSVLCLWAAYAYRDAYAHRDESFHCESVSSLGAVYYAVKGG